MATEGGAIATDNGMNDVQQPQQVPSVSASNGYIKQQIGCMWILLIILGLMYS